MLASNGLRASTVLRREALIASAQRQRKVTLEDGIRRIGAIASQRRHASSGNVLDTLSRRGLLHQVTAPNSLRHHLDGRQRTVYAGVDPSADSLHVGNLLPLMAALHFVGHGHKAIILIGGATGSIGDPSGRNQERQAIPPSTLAHNVACITQQVHDFFARADAYLGRPELQSRVTVVNNAQWYEGLGVLDFLREVGKHVRVTSMLARDSVKARLQPGEDGQSAAGLSFTEFSYQLLQAYDFSILHGQPWSCTVQLGGSDQMGNIMAGVDLIRRQKALSDVAEDTKEDQQPAYGLTLPLLTTASGAKFGKSAGNAVWLEARRSSHLDFYQHFLRSRDEDVETYLRTLTLLPIEEVDEIMLRHDQSRSQRFAQLRLARHMTELVRGTEGLRQAQVATDVLFNPKPKDLTNALITEAFKDDPRLKVLRREEVIGAELVQIAQQVGLVKSRGEARRSIANGGLYIGQNAVRDTAKRLSEEDIVPNTDVIMLRLGHNQHAVILQQQ